MQKYLAHVRQKSPHERRMEAIRWAGLVTGIIFLGWLATLSVRLASPEARTAAAQEAGSIQAQLAAVAQSVSPQQAAQSGQQPTSNYLEVAPAPQQNQTLNNY